MKILKYAIVKGLERLDTFLDSPWPGFRPGWGCRLRLSIYSFDLNERWGLDYWLPPRDDDQ